MFEIYRKGQGSYARVSVGIVLGLIAFFSAYAIYGSLIELPDSFSRLRIPLINIPLTWGLICSFLFFLLCAAFVNVLVGSFETGIKAIDNMGKRVVGFLIDTQGELQKVSWSSKQELIGSTIVVIVCAIALGLFIFGVDRVVTMVMKFIRIL